MNRQLYQPLHKKGKAIKNADPSGMKVCVTPPGKHFSSSAVLDEDEENLDGRLPREMLTFHCDLDTLQQGDRSWFY